jgi:hypothetical protein
LRRKRKEKGVLEKIRDSINYVDRLYLDMCELRRDIEDMKSKGYHKEDSINHDLYLVKIRKLEGREGVYNSYRLARILRFALSLRGQGGQNA